MTTSLIGRSPPVEDALLEVGGESPRHEENRKPAKQVFRQRAERFEFSILATEDDDEFHDLDHPRIVRVRQSVKPECYHNLLKHTKDHYKPRWRKEDPFYDLPEDHKLVMGAAGIKTVYVPSLLECQRFLRNEETEKFKKHAMNPIHRFINLISNTIAAFIIWFISMCTLETFIVILNAVGAAYWFVERDDARGGDWALKLDFSFLAFAVVFPLTFLIQSTFNRREQALSALADFKSALLASALLSLTIDWPDKRGEPCNGRLDLPETFNTQVVKDFLEFIKLIYEYLSMPQVAHSRNHIFWSKQEAMRRVHALQNGIVQDINDFMYGFSMRNEEMKKHGFPTGEASRLHQYNQYVQQRWEHLRTFKYYRTPQATRSFGRVYILVLPWMSGPYWAWLADGTSDIFAIMSSAFTSLVLIGLMNTQQGMEDPFLADYQSLMPGIDTIKLDFELAAVIQAIEQYYANAELQRALSKRKDNVDDRHNRPAKRRHPRKRRQANVRKPIHEEKPKSRSRIDETNVHQPIREKS